MTVYQGTNYYITKHNINGLIRFCVSKNLCVGVLYCTNSLESAVRFLKEID